MPRGRWPVVALGISRIRRHDEDVTVDPHRLAELRSLAYHRAIVAQWHALDAEAAARRFLVEHGAHAAASRPYLERWRALLDGPRAELFERMTADDEDGRALRQCTPFAGVLDPRDRWRIWAEVKREAEAA